ncbi:MAG: glycerol-3-phosphate 1-O-acyltransferase PlsY [Clostridia bacterium]|nr:glycerol-3-phosphate 1-O-acyltransferase PlsY [Clostridia bacterium]MBQ5770405.1 glycerol-3-phosphate 1-O-acyltransferase PlsY [Clostridia bacterium]
MNTFLAIAFTAIIGYLLGCISMGVIVSKAYARIDIRKYGSGNAGMTNVMRTLGWIPGAMAFAGDMLKGLLAALIGKWLYGEIGMCVGGLCAIIGHDWPVFLKFKGGKGISTSFGFILASNWVIALLLIPIQLAVVVSTGFMSLASISSSIAFVVLAIAFGSSKVYIAAAFIACALSIYCHRLNIVRLLQGKENKLDHRKITEKSKQFAYKFKNRKKDGQ